MDMVQMGSFLAELRKENSLTQAELGDKLGVTNKTISRWETGNYMPPVEMLEELSNLYGLTINELLSGKKLSTEEYKEMAEENIKESLKTSVFSFQEKRAYFKKKWLKDNASFLVLIALGIIAVFAVGLVLELYWLDCIAVMLVLGAHIWRNNTMMAYIEKMAFDGSYGKE